MTQETYDTMIIPTECRKNNKQHLVIGCISDRFVKCVGMSIEILNLEECMPDNRRVKMTKKMMKEALIDLLDKKPLEKISVTEICKSADVNRSTFYAYYEDISSLMMEIENEVLEHVTIYAENFNEYSDKRMLEVFEEFFEYVRENSKLFRVLIIQHDNRSFNRRMLDTIMEKYKMCLECNGDLPARYTYIYSISGVIGIMGEWIDSGFTIPSRKLAKMVWQMCVKATRKA